MPENNFLASFDKMKRFDSEVFRAFTYFDYTVKPHYHDFYEINIILSGKGTHCIEDNEIDVFSGDVFVISPGIIHFYKNTEKLDVFHIIIHPEFLNSNKCETEKIRGYSILMEIEPFIRKGASMPSFLRLSPFKLMEIKKEIENIRDGGVYDTEETRFIKHHSLWRLLYILSELIANKTEKEKHTVYEAQIMCALQYIHNNFGQKITIENLCRESYMSRSTFLRHFSEICRCTPLQYIQTYRITTAMRLMEEGKLTKTEIAQLCGFYDLSHMERIIKKYHSPESCFVTD